MIMTNANTQIDNAMRIICFKMKTTIRFKYSDAALKRNGFIWTISKLFPCGRVEVPKTFHHLSFISLSYFKPLLINAPKFCHVIRGWMLC